MKWFKHETTARHSEKLAALEHKTGLEGYGFYFKTLEIVAGLMDDSDKCQAEFSPTSWARQTNISTKKWLYLAQCCSEVGLMTVQRGADVVSVEIPKLLKRRDNYTKNLQVTSQAKVKNVSLEVEEKRREEEREEKATPDGDSGKKPVSPKASRIAPDWQPDEVLMAWAKAERSDLHLPTTVASFRDYWIGKSGKDATKADWSATFRNWVRREKGSAPVKAGPVDSWAGMDF